MLFDISAKLYDMCLSIYFLNAGIETRAPFLFLSWENDIPCRIY